MIKNGHNAFIPGFYDQGVTWTSAYYYQKVNIEGVWPKTRNWSCDDKLFRTVVASYSKPSVPNKTWNNDKLNIFQYQTTRFYIVSCTLSCPSTISNVILWLLRIICHIVVVKDYMSHCGLLRITVSLCGSLRIICHIVVVKDYMSHCDR